VTSNVYHFGYQMLVLRRPLSKVPSDLDNGLMAQGYMRCCTDSTDEQTTQVQEQSRHAPLIHQTPAAHYV
jgi:hypothetical protein